MLDWLLKLIGGKDDIDVALEKMKPDSKDPLRARVHGVLLVGEPADPGYRPDYAKTAMHEWYGLNDHASAVKAIEGYASSGEGYDVFRATFVARAAAGAGLISADESWGFCKRIIEKAQRRFPDWDTWSASYLEGHLAYRKSEGDDGAKLATWEKNLRAGFQKLHTGAWSAVALRD